MSGEADGLITPVILAGGTGVRLWPVSRHSMPKQFLPLVNGVSTFQATLKRVSDRRIFAQPIVMTNDDYRFHVLSQARELGVELSILLEPAARNSGPAIAAAIAFAKRRDGDKALVLTLASDHVILDDDLFVDACTAGRAGAEDGRIVTFGIKPTGPKDCYGYIRPAAGRETSVRAVDAFIEKPDVRTAAQYVAQGYYWNSGNLLFSVQTALEQLARHAPDVLDPAVEAVDRAVFDLAFVRLDPAAYTNVPSISIDYSLLEKTDRASVVEAAFRWSDIGDWASLWEVSEKDDDGNVTDERSELIDVENCLVKSDGAVVGLVGLQNLVIAVTADAVLVADKDRASDIRALVAKMQSHNRPEAVEHRLVRRPWGSSATVEEGDQFRIRHIVVHPGESLTLQRHLHRAEHWIVLRGNAEVMIDDKVLRLSENQSTYIPQGSVHRLGNPGKIPLELIEVQTGSYLGEDDIERLSSIGNRS